MNEERSPNRRIGSLNESSLHGELKRRYGGTSERNESKVAGFVADAVDENGIVEIQTGSFSKIKRKLEALLPHHRVRVVYPIASEKNLVVYDRSGEKIIYRRKSPKRGSLIDVVYELVHIPDLPRHPNFALEVLLIREEELRSSDGTGSWRRRGMRIVDRRLLEVVDRFEFSKTSDYLKLLPRDLPETFTNRDLGGLMGIPTEKARRLTYCLKRMGLVKVSAKEGNAQLFSISGGRTRDER